MPDKKKPRHLLTDFWLNHLRRQKAIRGLAIPSAVGSTSGSSGDAYREAYREVYGTALLAVERFRELAALEVQKNPEGARFQIGSVVARRATYLYRVWEDPVLCDAFIDGEKLRAWVLSSTSPTPLAIRQSGLVRQTLKDENARPQEGRIQEWQQLLRANKLAFEEALVRAISAYRAEVAGTESLTTATPKGNVTEADEVTPPAEGEPQPPSPDGPSSQSLNFRPEVPEGRKLVEAYIHEVYDKTGRRITRTDIWQAAGYRDATMFQRFQRDDPRCTEAARTNFNRLLKVEKPHLQSEE